MEELVSFLSEYYGQPDLLSTRKKVAKDSKLYTFGSLKLYTHKLLGEKLIKAFPLITQSIFKLESSCVRKKRGSDEWSVHSWNAAIDLNSGSNQMGLNFSQLKRKFREGVLTEETLRVLEMLDLDIGARWPWPDRMHVQLKISHFE